MSTGIQPISFKAMDKLMFKRQRSYYHGILDDKDNNPNIKFFSTNDGIGITFFDFNPARDMILSSPSINESREYAYFHFMLMNDIEFYGDNHKLLNRFDPGFCSLGFLQTDKVVNVQYKANKCYQYVCIHMKPALMFELMGYTTNSHDHLAEYNYFSIINSLPINNIQLQLIKDLFMHDLYEGALCNLYRESKLLELICVTAEKFQKSASCSLINIGKRDTITLHKARDILLQDIANPPSLKNLANQVGTNEFKLKKGFKQLFGQTVYSMLHEVRLLEAKRLIEQDGQDVQEAAQWVGYKSASHFSCIFKKRFGILPNKIKTNVTLISKDFEN